MMRKAGEVPKFFASIDDNSDGVDISDEHDMSSTSLALVIANSTKTAGWGHSYVYCITLGPQPIVGWTFYARFVKVN